MTWQSRQKTKKSYKEKAIGRHITDYASDYSLGGFEKQQGRTSVCGPVEYHTWYASVVLDTEGIVRKVD